MTEAGLSNETGEITYVNALARVAHLASSGSSMMLNTHDRKGNLRHNNALLCLASLTSISWTGWRRASTTGNCYLAVISTVFVNHIALLLRTLPFVTLRVSFVLRLRQSFPEDCVRLKLSSARASQAGLKEMIIE